MLRTVAVHCNPASVHSLLAQATQSFPLSTKRRPCTVPPTQLSSHHPWNSLFLPGSPQCDVPGRFSRAEDEEDNLDYLDPVDTTYPYPPQPPTDTVTMPFPEIQKPAPAFTQGALMPDKSFKDISLSDYKGKWVVLFWYG